ncbi:MAG: BatA domain-containing protein [Gemmatimonadetes bacterium]|nr:BatA domain-containing protein [Gemmatimonadota bacterium]
MIFLAPAFLVAAGIVAAGVVALHFLSTREPDTDLLPTVRFVPRVPVQATTITMRFTDPWLLALRVLLILLLGAALARPLIHPFAQPVSRITVVDVSRAVGSPGELVDSALGYVEGAAAVVFFDDEAREIEDGAVDSLESLRDDARWDRASAGSLSTALIGASRIASRLRDGTDSLQLVVVSPFAQEERDAATEEIRALWPGRIDAVRVAAAARQPDEAPTATRVEWADSGATGLWAAREPPDTIGGVRANDAVMVYPFVRRWQLAPGVAAEPADGNETRVYARWMDGEPAAFERATADGCMRSVAIPMPTEGDAILRPDFQRFLDGLEGPCGEPRDMSPLPEQFMAAFAGDETLAPASRVARQVMRVTPAVPWILGFALVVALAELWLRRRLASGARTNRAVERPGRSRAA